MVTQGKNQHEQIVRGFSGVVLGAQAIFHPDEYGKAARKEPADVAWVANRCAILFHLKAGGGSFDKKIKGNLNQLRGWLRAWRAGEVLRGTSEAGAHAFTFADVDYVVGLSVVDGGEVWCEYHADHVIRSQDLKLAACATITGTALRALMATGGSARDLVSLVSFLRTAGRRISEVDMIAMIHDRMGGIARTIHSQFTEKGLTPEAGSTALDQVMAVSSMLKHNPQNAEIAQVSADLTFADVLWFGIAAPIIEAQIAKPGEYGPLGGMMSRQSGIYTLRYIAGASAKEALDPIAKLLDGKPSITIAASLALSRTGPMRVISIQHRREPSMMEREVAALRAATLEAGQFANIS
ncbi:hypothetical protein [Novosphingobium sp. UBA1939]|uniref:hypothetical protein n=1 Tax=Novosphingobium sp. UBA1939 TaxID=1946982 RepID=UPI0025D48C6B|nr:hypothetical protein [Novosphingobium sp. UBA1939]